VKNLSDLDYDFCDGDYKSSIKKLNTSLGDEAIISVNRVSDEMLEKYDTHNISARQQ
jgi:hypothetical protein